MKPFKRRPTFAEFMKQVNRPPRREPKKRRKKRPPAGLVIGQWSNGEKYVIPDSVRFNTHMHVIGPSGFGKSYCLYSMICQDILAGRGVCVIDPHSELYFMVLNFLVQQQVDPSRVIIINPLLDEWTLRVNPLQGWDGLGSGTDVATEVMIRVAGDQDFEHMMRLRKYIRAGSLALEEANLPLALLTDLCSTLPAFSGWRQSIIQASSQRTVQLAWEEYAKTLTKTQQVDHIDSTKSRAMPFADDERVHRMMGFSTGNVDWKAVMDDQKIVLCNLGNLGGRFISRNARQLIGLLVTHGIGHAASRRTNGRARPFCVYCDEFGQYVSEDFAEALDGYRKFGVVFTLAHQRLKQIEVKSPNVKSAINDNCRIKLVFGGLGRESAEEMAKEIFTGYVDGNQVKYEKQTVAFRPVLEMMDIVSEAEGGTSGSGGASGYGGSSMASRASGSSSGDTVAYTPDGVCWTSSSTASEQSMSSEGSNWSESFNWFEARSWSRSTARVPVTTFEEFFQPPEKQFYGLDEQWEKKFALLMNLEARSVVVKQQGHAPAIVPTIDIKERIAKKELLQAYERAVCEQCEYVVSASSARTHLEGLWREHGLLLVQRAEPDSFAVPASSATADVDAIEETADFTLDFDEPSQSPLPNDIEPIWMIRKARPRKQIPEWHSLLEYVVSFSTDGMTDDKGQRLSGGAQVKAMEHRQWRNIAHVFSAIAIRNRLTHRDRNETITDSEIVWACDRYQEGVEDVLAWGDVPAEIGAAVRGM